MKVVIDRFEGEYAVCEKENGTMVNIEKARLPRDAKEGDVLIVTDTGIGIDHEERSSKEEQVKKLMDELWK